jgi:hypothetical protein
MSSRLGPRDPKEPMHSPDARALVALLQKAYSGELAAARAYHGHARSLRSSDERSEVEAIEAEELDHRTRVGEMLEEMGGAPSPVRERIMGMVGRVIGIICHISGWYVPMYGAGRLESQNVGEYEEAARLALAAERLDFIEDLLIMAEVEWDHEAYFHARCAGHWMDRWFPGWSRPGDREEIRESFARHRARQVEIDSALISEKESALQAPIAG